MVVGGDADPGAAYALACCAVWPPDGRAACKVGTSIASLRPCVRGFPRRYHAVQGAFVSTGSVPVGGGAFEGDIHRSLKFKTEFAVWPLGAIVERYTKWVRTSASFELTRCDDNGVNILCCRGAVVSTLSPQRGLTRRWHVFRGLCCPVNAQARVLGPLQRLHWSHRRLDDNAAHGTILVVRVHVRQGVCVGGVRRAGVVLQRRLGFQGQGPVHNVRHVQTRLAAAGRARIPSRD